MVKRCQLPGTWEAVVSFIGKYFQGAEVRTCYEAGYRGFALHRALVGNGISNIVVHAAHVEVEANRVKTDKRDSLKLAQQFARGGLKGFGYRVRRKKSGECLHVLGSNYLAPNAARKCKSGCDFINSGSKKGPPAVLYGRRRD